MGIKLDKFFIDYLYQNLVDENIDEGKIDYENGVVNYNEEGDFFYKVNTYSNGDIASILVVVKIKDDYASLDDEMYDYFDTTYREFYVEDSFEDVVDHIFEINENLTEFFDNPKNYRRIKERKASV